MTKRLLALALAVLSGVLGLAALGKPAEPVPASGPNVIVIMTDDMRADDMQFMPNTQALLADRGVTFEQSLSPYPLCCPARASLLSGQYSHNNGVQGNSWPRGGYYKLNNANTLPVWLHDQGYETAMMGKYLNEFGDRDEYAVPPGWDYFAGSVQNPYNYNHVVANENGQVKAYPRVYQTDLLDERAHDLVDLYQRSDRPYFMWISHVAPHAECKPHNGPSEGNCWGPPSPQPVDVGRARGIEPLHNPSINEADVSDKGVFMRNRPLMTPARLAFEREMRLRRIEALQAVDRSVANVVHELIRTDEYDNTYILFTSDNGFSLGEHRWGAKILGYEPDVRVPLIMAGPGIPHGQTRHQAVATVDLTATIADLTGTTPGRVQDGESLLPLATGATPDDGDRIVPLEAGPHDSSANGWWYRGVRTDRYTLIRWHSGDFELYDRQGDPYQLDSVAGDPRYADVQRRLTLEMDRLSHCAGAGCFAWYDGRNPAIR